eukprot:Gregarina_sp_Poly_1__5422@NODE_2866_length_1614_cov_9_565611_g1224_i2_p1_GENE_NODE_2866_length_1614_cov_9_565611_g1224_i2NODE_2866_length_1614_cov_9_565611_g1224_i2_p1_ORF_typecomplete_len266_score29_63_NODE_2866_length_1614_cov_9_565611_g1224_i24861283
MSGASLIGSENSEEQLRMRMSGASLIGSENSEEQLRMRMSSASLTGSEKEPQVKLSNSLKSISAGTTTPPIMAIDASMWCLAEMLRSHGLPVFAVKGVDGEGGQKLDLEELKDHDVQVILINEAVFRKKAKNLLKGRMESSDVGYLTTNEQRKIIKEDAMKFMDERIAEIQSSGYNDVSAMSFAAGKKHILFELLKVWNFKPLKKWTRCFQDWGSLRRKRRPGLSDYCWVCSKCEHYYTREEIGWIADRNHCLYRMLSPDKDMLR